MKSQYPGVVQLVARMVWDHQAAGSSPVTRTKAPLKLLISEGLYLFFTLYDAGFSEPVYDSRGLLFI